jgi:hypothetical protein
LEVPRAGRSVAAGEDQGAGGPVVFQTLAAEERGAIEPRRLSAGGADRQLKNSKWETRPSIALSAGRLAPAHTLLNLEAVYKWSKLSPGLRTGLAEGSKKNSRSPLANYLLKL